MRWGKTLAEDIQLDSQLFTEEILLVGASQSGQEVGKSGCQDKKQHSLYLVICNLASLLLQELPGLLTDGAEIQLVDKLRCLQISIEPEEAGRYALGEDPPEERPIARESDQTSRGWPQRCWRHGQSFGQGSPEKWWRSGF